MKFSVVIPAYNAENFIKRSVDSTLSQSFKPFEVIVVNDGSKDDTGKILDNYSHPVKIINQLNMGESEARNTGVREAKGDWIAFLDADDEWKPDHLQHAVLALRENTQCSWFSDGHEIRNEKDGRLMGTYVPNSKSKIIVHNDYFFAIPPTAFFSSSTNVVKRTVFDEVGLFSTKYRFGEDRDMWFRVALKYPNVAYYNDCGATVWWRENSLSKNKVTNINELIEKYHTWENLAKEQGQLERAIPRLRCWVYGRFKFFVKNKDFKSALSLLGKFYHLFPKKYYFIGIIIKKVV